MSTISDLEPVHTLTFSQALARAEVLARTTLAPEAHGRIEMAMALARQGSVLQLDSGEWEVTSQTTPGTTYHVNGTCSCSDAHYRGAMCKHRLSVYLTRKALQLMASPADIILPPDKSPLPPAPETPAAPVHSIDPRHMVWIQGKPFVKFAGLLDLAHKRGLQALQVTWTYNDAGLSLAQAVATFPFGTFTECGDASPENVTKKVAPHFRRCACTRAAARALRLALGLEMVAVEEIAEE